MLQALSAPSPRMWRLSSRATSCIPFLFTLFLCGDVMFGKLTSRSWDVALPAFFSFLPMSFFFVAVSYDQSRKRIAQLEVRVAQLEAAIAQGHAL